MSVFEELLYHFPWQLHHFTFLQGMHRTSNFSISSISSPLVLGWLVGFSYRSHLNGVKCLPSIALISISHSTFHSLLLFNFLFPSQHHKLPGGRDCLGQFLYAQVWGLDPHSVIPSGMGTRGSLLKMQTPWLCPGTAEPESAF